MEEGAVEGIKGISRMDDGGEGKTVKVRTLFRADRSTPANLGQYLQILDNIRFENWGGTVKNIPRYTCIPTTVAGVQSIINLAIKEKKRVRGAGFRHTWSDMYSKDGEILVSLLSLSLATGTSSEVHQDAINGPVTAFNKIEPYPDVVPGSDGKKRWARIGAGVTNEAFRIWAIANGWTLPFNVIMVE